MASAWRLFLGRRDPAEPRTTTASPAPEAAVSQASEVDADRRVEDDRSGVRQQAERNVGAAKSQPSSGRPGQDAGFGDDGPVDEEQMSHLGRRNELLHVRFSYMADRLEDLKSLTEDFNLLTRPIEEMAAELPRARARILEVEALMARELQENRQIKGELRDLRERQAVLADERSSAVKENRSLRESVDKYEATASEDRGRLADLENLLRNAERQAASGVENRERLEAEIGLLSAEIEERNDTLHALQVNFSRMSDRTGGLERENTRLQKVVDDQVLQVVNLQSRASDQESLAEDRLQEIDELRGKLDAEHSERQKAAHAHDIALSSLTAEKSSLSLKVEALNARLQSAEQTVSQAREQIADKDTSIRSLEETLRASGKERGALDRKVMTLEASVKEQGEQNAEGERLLAEAKKRADMLAKALSAKSAALENALEKAQARSDRIDELSKRFDQERSSLEMANRRLVEELENERAERTLAQGALKIARESRASLQRQNESLKRSNRAMRKAAADGEGEPYEPEGRVPVGLIREGHDQREATVEETPETSNVSVFAVPKRGYDEE